MTDDRPENAVKPAPAGRRPELLAPGGSPEAALAALHYGADAVYLGLKRFSARADAENSRGAERHETLLSMAELRLHASTQMAIHGRAGVETLRRLGFARATLARELTLDEVRAAAVDLYRRLLDGTASAERRAAGEAAIERIAAGWPLYVVNRLAARELRAMGARRVTLSPEDGLANMRAILTEMGDAATVVVFQDTPLFVSETCVFATLHGCPGPARCEFTSAALASAAGARRLRADFVHRAHEPLEVRAIRRALRSGRGGPPGRLGNFERGLF